LHPLIGYNAALLIKRETLRASAIPKGACV
jgi:hypothetical protein